MRPPLRRLVAIQSVAAFLLCGAVAISAQQLPVQTLGGSNTDQSNCSPSDPSCGSMVNQIPFESRTPQQTGTLPAGAVIPSTQAGTQQNQTQSQQQYYRFSQLPLDAPTEFQQMVANSVGKMLPIFGANLFRNPPSTFAPATVVPVTPDYVLGPGDELVIQSWGQVSTDGRFRVDRSGDIFVPQVGTLHVAGLRFDQVQPALKSRMDKLFRNYSLNVTMGQLRSIQVIVVGQARQPGTYTISSLSTLVNAIFTTGGPSAQGSLRHIQLKRGGQLVVDFDLYDLLVRGDKSKDVPLLAGDVIYIPPAGPQVAVAGNVKVPAIYELRSPENTSVEDVLELAAGLTNTASRDKVRLERIDERHTRRTMEVSLQTEAKTTMVQDGDLLEIVAVAGEFKDSVTLRGNVANPGRYAWKPGMRVKDLIPTKDALITRDYWLKRSQLGQPMLTYVPTCLPTTPYGVPNLRYGIPVGEAGDDPFWRYSSIDEYRALKGYPAINFDRVPERNDLISPSTMYSRRDPAREPAMDSDGGLDCSQYTEVPYYVSNFALMSQQNNSQTANNAGNPETVAAQTQAALGTTAANQTSAASASLGADSRPTVTNFRPKNDVKLSEPDIDWSYAVIERQDKETLTTSLLPFNLGKVVLQGDASQNLELQPGDVVTIFSKADLRVPQSQQTRFVRLEGEFMSSGIYSVKPGETLRQLVARAGGLSPDAYLYGAEFTRESTRRVQQQRLNEYVDQIALQASTIATANASRSINPQDTAAATAQQAQAQTIIANLRKARASGRVVLELPPDANNINQLPDLPLEDGDRFIVPRVPSTVSIEGAVYNQNAFLYDPHRRLGDYVKLAGGATRDADKNRAYVIRAGGAVISKQYSSSLRGNGFNSLRLYPGDTVVIPLNLDKGKTMRLVVDIAQIVGQFGIAIAAANTVLGQ
ncbi:SLBB domain-containing protein [Edaphobacter sp. 12200R-103]|uniref:SLBB domain-containing protein n=1 Tax=Edaphobacter sp. 12200R-103 TaxID=2703788 RepID=UPI00138C9308|nr:SLBB domain-containing protein [Edaphobacter sp. 12200R-103]QHS52976.1 sugar transporter [Edaphobacter sp. 12200R-103]